VPHNSFPQSAWIMVRYFAELIRYRDLLFWLTVKEIKVRYKSPVLGLLWSLLVPLVISGILFVVFTYMFPTPNLPVPFFLFLIVAMFPWNFFSSCVACAPMSVLEAGQLIKKSRFPRALIPLSIVAANVVNFIFSLIVVLVILTIMRLPLSGWVWVLPIIIGVEILLTVGIVLLVASLQVQFRDVKYLTEIGLLLWFYLTPIFYPLDAISHSPFLIRAVYLLNPFVYVVELFRAALLGGLAERMLVPPLLSLGIAIVSSVGICLLGVTVFRRLEPKFADQVMG